MQGPIQRGDQPPDPRESTVSMPRIDPSSLAGRGSEPAAAMYDGEIATELPGFGDPYALPVRAGRPSPTRAGDSGGSSPAPVAAPAPAPTAELAETSQVAAPPEPDPAVARLPDPDGTALPATPDPPLPEELVAPKTPDQPDAVRQGALGNPPRRAVRRADPGPADKPALGSIAELRGRLDRLPDGHPSSPYDDAGWLKPSPIRLRQLELGLPARSLGTPAGYADRFGLDPDDDRAIDGLPQVAAADQRPQVSNPGGELPGPASADSDDGDEGRLSPGGTTPRNPTVRLQHPYADSAEPDQAANGSGSGELTLTRWPHSDAAPDGGPGPDDRRNGHHPAKPAETGRAEPARPDRERRRPDLGLDGLPRSGDRVAVARVQLAPEIHDLVDRILAGCRAAEGRNARGGYGTSGLTPALRRIASGLPAGRLAAGSEADTLKPADRFATRLARLIDRQPGRPPAELAATIGDAIRYAFTFPAADYTEGTLLVHRKLKAQGFDLEARRNQWDSREYKGVFTRWRDPAHGLAFEVQFHTADSWAVVKQTHDAYLRITDPATPAAERARLRARQAAAAATISPPPGSLDIADFRAGVR